MKKGLDASRDLTKFASELAGRYDFVARYYNAKNASKNLTLGEANILSTAGLAIVVVWEDGRPTNAGYFSYEKGVDDGTSAYFYALHTISQPASTPIYFAVDYDATQADLNGPITSYFQGIRDGFNTISNNDPSYIVGVYGSGLVCSGILSANLASYSWLTMSGGWRGSRTFNAYNIKQLKTIQECADLGGVEVDTDSSPNDNEGSFSITTHLEALGFANQRSARTGNAKRKKKPGKKKRSKKNNQGL